jgi:hypothetical protein
LCEQAEALFIDTDSYQFGQYPCPVATEVFLDPALYGLDLATQPYFQIAHDWYSFAVLLFRTLTLVHPYGGTHLRCKSLVDRAKSQLSVFDSEVIYPKIALSLNFLNDALSQSFYKIFAKGQRFVFPLAELEAYGAELQTCKVCGSMFPASRRVCPNCQPHVIYTLPKTTVEVGMLAQLLIKTDGPILHTWQHGTQIYAICHEGSSCVLYHYQPQLQTSRFELCGWQAGLRFEWLTDHYLIVNPANSDDLLVFEFDGQKLRPLLRTKSGCFEGKAVFATSQRYLYRLAGNMLVRCEMHTSGLSLVEQALTTIMPEQSWFALDSSSDTVIGFQRIFSRYEWFRLDSKSYNQSLTVSELASDEKMIAYAALGHAEDTLVLRYTRQLGVDYLRLDNCGATGQSIFSQRRLADPNIPMEVLDNLVYNLGIVLWPDDNGINKEKLGKTTLRLPTSQVSGASHLTSYLQGLLVTNDNTVTLLTLTK